MKAYTYRKDRYYIQQRIFTGMGLTGQFPQYGVKEIITKSLLKFLFYKLQFWKYKNYVGKKVIRDKKL